MDRKCYVCDLGPPLKYLYGDFTAIGIRREYGFLLCPEHRVEVEEGNLNSLKKAWERVHGS